MSRSPLTIARDRLRRLLMGSRRVYLRAWGMEIAATCDVSFSAKLDKTHPRGIHIGEESVVTFGVVILSHDFLNSRHLDTRIGEYCFIGARSILLPGVSIGDRAIVAAGSVVTRDVPSDCTVAGNPARIIKHGPSGDRDAAVVVDEVAER